MGGEAQTIHSAVRPVYRARRTALGRIHRKLLAGFVRVRGHLVATAFVVCWSVPPWYGGAFSLVSVVPVALAGTGIYQLNRLYDTIEDGINAPHEWTARGASRRAVGAFAWTSLLASVVVAQLIAGIAASGFIAVVVVSGVLYSRPTRVDNARFKRLKNVPVLKNLVPALVWATSTVAFPAAVSGDADRFAAIVMTIVIASSVFAIEVAWDIRDEQGDRAAGVLTLPVLVGADRSASIAAGVTTAAASATALLALVGEISHLWLLPAAGVLGIGVCVVGLAHRLAANRSWSHGLVSVAASMLLALGVAGRWGSEFLP